MQPHFLTIQLPSRCRISAIAFYTRFEQDQSYTPHKFSVRAGTTWNDVEEVVTMEQESPDGWVCVDLRNVEGDSVFASMLQLVILSNHQQGRDSHLRCFKLYGPAPERWHTQHSMASLLR